MPWDGSIWIPHETMEGNVTTLVDVVQYVNDVTDGVFGILTLVALFVILLAGFMYYSKKTESALAGAMYITTVVSFLMAALDMVMDEAAWAMLILMIPVTVLLYLKGGSESV